MTQYLVAIHLPDDFDASSADEALAWGRKAVVACRAPVEVRALFPSDLTALLARRPLKEGMTQYLAAGHLPENFDPSSVTEAMMRDMEALNEEMEARVSGSWNISRWTA